MSCDRFRADPARSVCSVNGPLGSAQTGIEHMQLTTSTATPETPRDRLRPTHCARPEGWRRRLTAIAIEIADGLDQCALNESSKLAESNDVRRAANAMGRAALALKNSSKARWSPAHIPATNAQSAS